MSGEPTVTPLDALCVTECVCCGKAMWADLGSLDPICEECEEARKPLLAEIERLKAELAKFYECEPDARCLSPVWFVSIHRHAQPKVYHKEEA